jgi:hypothetical protein
MIKNYKKRIKGNTTYFMQIQFKQLHNCMLEVLHQPALSDCLEAVDSVK